MATDGRQLSGSACLTTPSVSLSPWRSLGFCTSAVFWNDPNTKERSKIMFNSLDEQIERGKGRMHTKWERSLQYAGVLLVSAVLFGGLYFGIRFLE